MRLRREIIWFAVGGVIGFLVDAGIVEALVTATHWNPYTARLVSFLTAASVTWWWNRTVTFSHRRRHRASGEWVRWLAVMAVGAGINYGVYALVLALFAIARAWPVLGVAAGSLGAAGCNFAGARTLVFSGSKNAP